jgi:ATP-dependent helicase/nuclease subunit A
VTTETPVDQPVRDWATDPAHHVVLEASAGTGKTRVLVDRYLALLDAGVDPAHILAITFTRKAAAEMRERILTDLATRYPARWQALRDRAQDIAVSTIDAFCFALLREFPLEAGLDPGFSLADETEIARLTEMAIDAALRESRRRASRDEAVRLAFAQLSLSRLAQGLRALLERRFVAPAALRTYLRGRIRGARSEAMVAAQVRDTLRREIAALPGGARGVTDSGPAGHPGFELGRRDLERLLHDDPLTPAEVRAAIDGVANWVLTRAGEVRKRPVARKADFASPAAYATHTAALPGAGAAVLAALARFDGGLNVLLARGIYRIFRLTLRRYRETLVLHDALDFSEVLARAVALLRQMDEFSRSRFRLESRYQHVLVDEFQDTSRLQWALVAELIRSWGEGAGLGDASSVPPSIFVVGDRKQSIYRFRDADVSLLDEATQYIEQLGPQAQVRRAITQSFRSVPALLAFTNDVAAAMVDPGAPGAVAFRYADTDRFPVAPASGDRDRPDALGLVIGDDAEACARGVAQEIVTLLAEGTVTDRETRGPRRVRPGDVAILFRSRESHREFEQALADRHVPSYVYKGLGFYDADEIKDLVALVRFLAVPDSDLRAAALLRSRLVGLSDEGLRRLAPSLAAALQDGVHDGLALSPADAEALGRWREAVPRWQALAASSPPADVVDRILEETAYAFEWRGARAGQARENVKKFRALLRRIQNRGYATMARISAHIDRLSAGDESNAALNALDAVNLMTIHASKGLEFPIVFVVNITRATGGIPPAMRVVAGDDDRPLVAVSTYDRDTARVEAGQDREETKRLAYVALTRARERLYLSAPVPRTGRAVLRGSLAEVLPPDLVALLATLPPPQAVALEWAGSGGTHRFRVCDVPPAQEITEASPLVVATDDDVPSSLLPLPPPASPRGSVIAQALGQAVPARTAGVFEGEADDELLIGRLVHRLLARGRPTMSDADLAGLTRTLVAADEEGAVAAALEGEVVRLYRAVHQDADLRRWLSHPDARFEVPVSLRVDEPDGTMRIVRGTIDCVVPVDGRVLVIEFKTGQPRRWHERQLEIYRDAVARLWTGEHVEGRLVYAGTQPAPLPAAGRLPFD